MRHTLTIVTALTLASLAAAGPMHEEKLFEVPEPEYALHPRMPELMAWGLGQPDQLTRLSAMNTVSKYKLAQLAQPLIAMLDDPSPLIRTTAIRTLGDIDAKAAADRIARFAQFRENYAEHELNAALAADAALTRWQHSPAADAWQKRLMNETTPLALRISAARGLGAVQQAGTDLQRLVSSNAPITLRLAAADALAQSPSPQTQAVAAADALLDSEPLLAARLLARSDGDQARGMLVKLAQNDNPAVQAMALTRLLELDAALIWPISDQLIASADPKVRLLTLDAQKDRREPAAVKLLAAALDDAHPRNRNTARQYLQGLTADVKLDALVRQAAAEHLAVAGREVGSEPAPHWRAAEQAAILLAALDEKSAAPALLAIMEAHPRVEVRVAAVAALRDIAVPSTFGPVQEYLGRLSQRIEANTKARNAGTSDVQEGQRLVDERMDLSEVAEEAAQAMGTWGISDADALLRKFIPKHYAESQARSGAIWSLGRLHEGRPDPKLVEAFINRIYDLNPLDPESDDVRVQSIIALARMKANDAETIGRLENRYKQDEQLQVQSAARWAAMQLSGKDLPPVTPEQVLQSESFVMPTLQ